MTGNPQANDTSVDDPSRHINDAGCFASDGELELIKLIDLRGAAGEDGRDGISYFSTPAGAGHRGRDGGDATKPRHGENAKSVNVLVTFADGPRSGSIKLIPNPSLMSYATQDAGVVVPIGESGYIFFDAAGGKGGNGGRGGDGGPGSDGYRGRDATRFSSGGNGGPGGDGGDAGEPSDGADGGDGGDVTITVDAKETGLLMLLKGNLANGDLGFAGEPGVGGQGGSGGPGGSSYHWTESKSYRDSQGKTQTRIIHRSNPGGFRGSDGDDGSPSRYRARDGMPGLPGRLKIIVKDAQGGRAEYKSPYDFELITFDVVGENEILEPDSIVSIDNIEIRNVGGMPSPPNDDIRVLLESDEWILREGDDLVMRQSLMPGQSHVFAKRGLRFRLGDYEVDQPRRRPFRLRHLVNPGARLESGIGRPFRNFENGEEIDVRFPVQLQAITSLNSLAPGESTRVIWAVTNIGSESFDHDVVSRAVTNHVRLMGGDIDPNHLMFFDTDDKPFDIATQHLSLPIRHLDAGKTQIFETRIGVKDEPSVIHYHGFAVGIDLYLQRPKTSARRDEYRRVDCRKTFIRVSERYLKESGSRFLLVANHRTDVNDIQKWTQMADYFGSSLDVWDVSYYGFFDLIRDVEKDQSLLEQWRGMTIIVPNNYYETPAGRTVAFSQLAKQQFLMAAADYDINFYIVGDSRTGGAEMLQNSLIPVGGDETPGRLKTQQEFLNKIKRWNKYIERSGEVVGNQSKAAKEFADTELGATQHFAIERRTILFQPKPEWLEQEAIDLQRKLCKIDPLHRWVIVHRYDTGDTDTSWGFFKKRQVGRLEARRTLDSTKGSAVLYEVDAIDMVSDEFITSSANKHGMFLALKFEDKVDRFIRLVSERKFPRFNEEYIDRPLTDQEIAEIGRELVDSILVDIFNEQRVARTSRTWGRWSVKPLLPKLNYLAERSLNYGVTYAQMQQNEAGMQLLFDLIANLRYMANRSKTIWDSAIIPTSFFKRSRAVTRHMDERTKRIVVNIFGNEPSWWSRVTNPGDDFDAAGKAKRTRYDGMERTIANRRIREIEERLRRERPGVEMYSAAQDREGLTYDPELLPETARVMPSHVYDQLVRAEALENERRQATEKSTHLQRADLLVPLAVAKTIATQTVTVSSR